MKDHFAYVGTLRNEKLFNIGDNVFFSYGRDIFKGRIIGVELPPEDNPSYLYKVQIPKELLNNELYKLEYLSYSSDKYKDWLKTIVLKCDSMFSTVQEAKESAIKNLERMAELQREEIENYFKQFE